MDFETLINSPKEVIREYLEEPTKLKEMGVNLSQLGELIKKAGESITYVEDLEMKKLFNLLEYSIDEEEISNYDVETINNFFVELIRDTGKVEEYLKNEEMIKNGFGAYIILATGKSEEYMAPEKLIELGLEHGYDAITELIRATNNPEKYLFEGQDIHDRFNMANIIKGTGKIEEYLTPEKLLNLGLSDNYNDEITELIRATNNPERYLFEGQDINDPNLHLNMANIIKVTNNPERYLFEGQDINDPNLQLNNANIIKGTGKIEEYLTPEKLRRIGLLYYADEITKLIKATNNPERYLFEGQDTNDPNLRLDMANIIKVTGNVEKYLTPEKVNEFGLLDNNAIIELIKLTNNPEKYLLAGQDINDRELQLDISNIIIATGDIEKYLTLEKLDELKMLHDYITITNLIKITPNPEKYLFEGQSLTDMLNICNVLKGTICQDLSRDELTMLVDFEVDTIKMVANMSSEKKKAAIKILNRLYKSNSAELRRISNQMALQILENSPEEYEKTLDTIENIYLTSNVPNVGKLYLVFKELHPNLLGENTKMQDASIGDIPSLNEATTSERKNIIFTSLLMSAVESNNRNLRNYIEMIEQGDDLFKKIRNSETKIENLTKQEKGIVTKYNELLNYLYNQSNKEEKRENTGDIEKDINELAKLFRMDDIERKMPDRLTRLFAHRAGIRSLAEAEKIMNESREKADKRNTELAEDGSIYIEEGDFVKGVADTEYFPSMFDWLYK